MSANKSAKPIEITEEQALMMQWKLIKTWKPRFDVWPFTYGNAILASTSAVTGIYLNASSRRFLHLGPHGFKASYVPMVALPPLFSALAHSLIISSDILVRKTECPICLESQAIVIQLGVGLLYPLLLAPVASMFLAKAFQTYPIPAIKNFDEMGKLLWSMTKKRLRPIGYFALVHVLLTTAITHLEMGAMDKIEAKLDAMSFE